MEQIGQRIKELRTESGLTQKDLAEMIGVAQNTVSQYENGTASTSLEIIIKLSEVFHTTTDYLLLGKD